MFLFARSSNNSELHSFCAYARTRPFKISSGDASAGRTHKNARVTRSRPAQNLFRVTFNSKFVAVALVRGFGGRGTQLLAPTLDAALEWERFFRESSTRRLTTLLTRRQFGDAFNETMGVAMGTMVFSFFSAILGLFMLPEAPACYFFFFGARRLRIVFFINCAILNGVATILLVDFDYRWRSYNTVLV